MGIIISETILIERKGLFIGLRQTHVPLVISCNFLCFTYQSLSVRFDESRTPKIGNDGRQGTFYFYFPVRNARHDKEIFVEEGKKFTKFMTIV